VAKTPKAPFPGQLFEEWLVETYGDVPSLAMAMQGAFSQGSIYAWKRGESWPGGDAMIALHRLGCNVLRFGDPSLPMFSDTVEGRAQARKSGAAVAESQTAPTTGATTKPKKSAKGEAAAEKVVGTSYRFLEVGPEDPEVANLSDPADLLAFIAEQIGEVRSAMNRELDILSSIARRSATKA
jgi:hypothetical protein